MHTGSRPSPKVGSTSAEHRCPRILVKGFGGIVAEGVVGLGLTLHVGMNIVVVGISVNATA